MTPAPLVILDEIDSTNAEARRLAEAGELGPRWIVARRQTAGRGRRGRAWIDKPGNLAATLLIRVQSAPQVLIRGYCTTTHASRVAVQVLIQVRADVSVVYWPITVAIAVSAAVRPV